MAFKNDMAMMLGMHAALRRELVRIRRVVDHPGDDPKKTIQAAAGWELFKSFLHVHHGAEDAVLWPAMRLSLASDDSGLALLDAMEAEHSKIDPLLENIDVAVSGEEGDPGRLAELVNALSTALLNHIDHEEYEGIPLIDATVTAETWGAFSAEHGKRLGPSASKFFPWVFEGAQPAAEAAAIGQLPPPVQQAWRSDWAPAYAKLELWPRFAIDPLGQ